MFKKILFATSVTEGSDHAARVAFNLAKIYNSHLSIIHVIGAPARGFSYFVLDTKTNEKVEVNDDYFQWVKEEISIYYANQIENLKSYNISVMLGDPYREILRENRKLKPDIIILGGKTNKDRLSKVNLVGSTIHKVSKTALCPVLVVNRPAASFWGDISNVVFVTELLESSDAAFRFALKLSDRIKGELRVFGTVNTWGKESNISLTQDEIDLKLNRAIDFMRKRYLPSIKNSNCNDYFLDVWEGISYIETVKYARENFADLIVLSSSFNKEKTLSNTSINHNIEQIIARAGCPVLILNKKDLMDPLN